MLLCCYQVNWMLVLPSQLGAVVSGCCRCCQDNLVMILQSQFGVQLSFLNQVGADVSESFG